MAGSFSPALAAQHDLYLVYGHCRRAVQHGQCGAERLCIRRSLSNEMVMI